MWSPLSIFLYKMSFVNTEKCELSFEITTFFILVLSLSVLSSSSKIKGNMFIVYALALAVCTVCWAKNTKQCNLGKPQCLTQRLKPTLFDIFSNGSAYTERKKSRKVDFTLWAKTHYLFALFFHFWPTIIRRQ